jgi:hypothetical protein
MCDAFYAFQISEGVARKRWPMTGIVRRARSPVRLRRLAGIIVHPTGDFTGINSNFGGHSRASQTKPEEKPVRETGRGFRAPATSPAFER